MTNPITQFLVLQTPGQTSPANVTFGNTGEAEVFVGNLNAALPSNFSVTMQGNLVPPYTSHLSATLPSNFSVILQGDYRDPTIPVIVQFNQLKITEACPANPLFGFDAQPPAIGNISAYIGTTITASFTGAFVSPYTSTMAATLSNVSASMTGGVVPPYTSVLHYGFPFLYAEFTGHYEPPPVGHIIANLRKPTASMTGVLVQIAHMDCNLTPLSVEMIAVHDATVRNVWGLSSEAFMPFNNGDSIDTGEVIAPLTLADKKSSDIEIPFNNGIEDVDTATTGVWALPNDLDGRWEVDWGLTETDLEQGSTCQFQRVINYNYGEWVSPYIKLEKELEVGMLTPFVHLDPIYRLTSFKYNFAPFLFNRVRITNKFAELASVFRPTVIPWGHGFQLDDGVTHGRPPKPPAPDTRQYPPAPVTFYRTWGSYNNPVFGELVSETINTKILPARNVYVINNTAELRLYPSGTYLDCKSLTVSSSKGDWGWTLSADVPASIENLIKPNPGQIIELELTINTTEVFRFLVRGYSRSRKFGSSAITLSAISRTAWLASPFAPKIARVNHTARTANQLISDALNEMGYNGTSNFITANSSLDDWLVPINAFSHEGTVMEYIAEVASSVGAVVQSNRKDLMLNVQKEFPVLGWQFDTVVPDYIADFGGLITEDYTWTDNPAYDSVTLIGSEVGGVLTFAVKDGKAGSYSQPAITHNLFTDEIATRQRANKELSVACRVINTSITMPIHPELGIIDPLKFIKIVEGSSQVVWINASTNVNVTLPKINQTLNLERYEYLD